MGIDLHAKSLNIRGLKKLLGEEISVEIGFMFKRIHYEDGETIEDKPMPGRFYEGKLLELGEYGIFLENKEKIKDASPKKSMILFSGEKYINVPIPEDKIYLPYLDGECVYNEKKQDITYVGILSVKHNNDLIYQREALY